VGLVIQLESRRPPNSKRTSVAPRDQLPLMLARLLAAGATDFTRVALDAWGKQEIEPEELVELCTTYAAVAGLESIS
jgi:hypothetical protein